MPTDPPPPGGAPDVPGYDVGELLGEGGSAQVWRATRRPDGFDATGGAVDNPVPWDVTSAEVAIKIVRVHDGVSSDAARAEAALLTALDHPHLIALHETIELPPVGGRARMALVLDFAGGGSLAGLLRRRGRLAPGEVITAVTPIATALAYVHDLGLIHGDVTPGNVVFTAAGMPLLADLGVAAVVGSYAEVRTTAAYADPAVAAGGRPTPAADVFMLAATAFHALTGAPPWPDPLPGLALARAATADLGPLQTALEAVPTAVREVLLEALRPEPHLRPSAAAFALDLRHAMAPVAVELRAGRTPSRPGFNRPEWSSSGVATGERVTRTATGRVRAREEADADSASVPKRSILRRHRPAPPRSDDQPSPAPAVGPTAGDRRAGAARHAQPRSGPRSRPRSGARSGARSEAQTGARSGARRPAVLAVIGIVAVGLAVGAWSVGDEPSGRRSGDAGPTSAAAGVTAGAPSTGDGAGVKVWTDVLDGLDERRAQAYATRDPDALEGVFSVGALLDRDRAQLTTMVPEQCNLTGAHTSYRDVTAVGGSSGSVVLDVHARLAASVLHCPGVADADLSAVPDTALRITLTAVGDGYRISGQQLLAA